MNHVHLIILDGFGLGKGDRSDAIAQAKTPFLDKIFDQNSWSRLKTDGECVGLPSFQTGGSEVGHITIGSGRVVKQMLTKINDQIDSGKFFENAILKDLFAKAQKRNKIHLLGLCSDGGIHSFLPHLFGLQRMAKEYGIENDNIFIHAFLDGRDVGERTAKTYLQQIEDQGIGSIATIGGRFYGMDRDTNYDRVQPHYQVLTGQNEPIAQSWNEYLDAYYQSSDQSDYYVPPACLNAAGTLEEDDVVIFFNYRTDRARQISAALFDDKFPHFDRPKKLKSKNYGIFGDFYEAAQKPFSFKKEAIPNTIGELVANQKGTQLRITETEKFNHVTFFFSGERKEEFPGEKRILIPSPKCATYAEKPEMSAREQTEKLIKEIDQQSYNLIVQNYANSDLVGHSGNLKAAIEAVEILDECLAKIVPISQEKGYEVLITADHGNSDEMILPNGEESAAHSKNLVPCCLLSQQFPEAKMKETGTLADIAPTICELLGIEKPEAMTGESLIEESS